MTTTENRDKVAPAAAGNVRADAGHTARDLLTRPDRQEARLLAGLYGVIDAYVDSSLIDPPLARLRKLAPWEPGPRTIGDDLRHLADVADRLPGCRPGDVERIAAGNDLHAAAVAFGEDGDPGPLLAAADRYAGEILAGWANGG